MSAGQVKVIVDALNGHDQFAAAKDLAQAQVDLARIQTIRAAQWTKIILNCEAKDLARLASLDRYERYALARRRKASKANMGGPDG